MNYKTVKAIRILIDSKILYTSQWPAGLESQSCLASKEHQTDIMGSPSPTPSSVQPSHDMPHKNALPFFSFSFQIKIRGHIRTDQLKEMHSDSKQE